MNFPRAKKRRRSPTKFQEKFIYMASQYARDGMNDSQLAAALKISLTTLDTWKKRHKSFRDGIIMGRRGQRLAGRDDETFVEFIYKRLDPQCQEVWDLINKAKPTTEGFRTIEAAFKRYGERMRQSLFCYAYVANTFSLNRAMHKCGVTYRMYKRWLKDPAFNQLLEAITFHKKAFFEECLIKLVRDGDTMATVFANRTFNRDLGYHEKVTVETDNAPAIMSLSALGLPLEQRKAILERLREAKELELKDANPDAAGG